MKEITIEKIIIKEQLMHSGQNLLSITIEYPEMKAEPMSDEINVLNAYYQQAAEKLLKYGKEVLMPMQIESFQFAQFDENPFRPGELFLTYQLTLQSGCLISMFFDQYEYLGGAHGSTDRFSQTWNTNRGSKVKLHECFEYPKYFKDEVIEMIRDQITEELDRGEDKYYKECLIDVEHMFKEDNFYLTPKGVVIYFQQYEIAPYVSGIPEFILPFNSMIHMPKC